MNTRQILSLGLIFMLLLTSLPLQQASASTITVNTTSGETDGSCSDGDCSLGDAIAVANSNPGTDTIEFGIDPGSCMGGVCSIYLTEELPALTDGGTTINGYSQSGASRATSSGTAVIKIEVNGINLTTNCGNILFCNGLIITSSNNVIDGLSMHSFHNNAIAIGNAASSSTADNNTIKGSYIGVSSNGTAAPGNGFDGVFVGFNASYNTIGGTGAAQRNVISGNNIGVEIWSGNPSYAAANNLVIGNYIGADHTGLVSLPNLQDGIRIYGGAHDNTIGGDTSGERNVIVGNGRSGVRLSGDETQANVISGNYIGVAKNGFAPLGNVSEGIYIGQGAHLNTVGGDALEERNVISGNLDAGVVLTGTNTMSNTVSANVIGLNSLGLAKVGNSGSGVYIYNASHNQIGGNTEAQRNYIAGNFNGVSIYGAEAHENQIIGNTIGTNPSDSSAVSNSNDGIYLGSGAHDNHIGGGSGEGNLISGNDDYGIELNAAGSGNHISGNTIGTDSTGLAALGNDNSGVALIGADSNIIGGTTLEEFNLISGNASSGIMLANHSSENTISGNIIGLNANLNATLPNNSSGISLASSSNHNVIGGTSAGSPLNYICGNNGDGIHLYGGMTVQNEISGNLIGYTGLGNNGAGITLLSGANNNTIGGGEQKGNFIGYNHQFGVVIDGDGSDSNLVSDNYISLNTLGGVLVSEGEDNQIGPDNIIGLNSADGVWIYGSGTDGNLITQNSILVNSDLGIHLEAGANGGILAPEITAQDATTISGTACAGCAVELFASGDTEGEGWVYLNTTTAAGDGSFVFNIVILPYPYLTATATDAVDGTSEFSEVFTSIYEYVFLPLVQR